MTLDVPSKPEFYDSMNLISEIINKNIINHNTSESNLGEAFFYLFAFLRTYDLDGGASWETEVIQPTNSAAKNGCQGLD